MASNFSVFFTDTASGDLSKILDYITNTLCNSTAAREFYLKLTEELSLTAQFPSSGTPVTNPFLLLPDVRKILIKNYTVFYFPDYEKRRIVLLRIVYSRKNLDEILRTLKE